MTKHTLHHEIETRKRERMTPPLRDALGRPIQSPNGRENAAVNINPAQQLLALYFACVPAIATGNHGAAPDAIAREAMDIAKAALANIGITFTEHQTAPPETP